MKKIIYTFANGTKNMIEVSDEIYTLYQVLEKTDRLNDRKHFRRSQSLERSLDNGWDIANPKADTFEIFEKKKRNEKLHAAIATLKPAQQTLIKQVFFDCIPQVVIAEQQGITKMALHNRLVRILRKLKKVWE